MQLKSFANPYISGNLAQSSYSPFGSVMLGRDFRGEKYRFGFNTQEKVTELGSDIYTAEFWMYNAQLGRRWNVDPLSDNKHNIGIAPYSVLVNNPIKYIDPNGADWVEGKNGDVKWNKDVTAANHKEKGVLKEGEIYRGTAYEREKIWSNINVRGNIENGLMKESYLTTGKMEYKNLTPWVDKAFEEMNKGISETGSNPEITKYWQYTQIADAAKNGDKWAQSVLKEDKTPWCAAFVNYNLETSGIGGSKSALAFTFKNYGQDLGYEKPIYGSIAVMNYSHVGIVVGINKDGRVILLGGNQGDAVNLSPNSQSAVIKYVYPSGYTPTTLTPPQYNLKGRSLTNATSR